MSMKPYTLTLEWAKMITPNVRHLAFRYDDTGIADFIPGQFITIHFKHGDKMLRRSYSIATQPGTSDLIEFAAGFVEGGLGTELLFGLKPGDTVTATGPFGRLVLQDVHPARYILVATSTGVTPYLCMLQQIATLSNVDIVVLEGVQKREDLLYGDDFTAFAKAHPHFTFRAHYSRESQDALGPHEHCGYVQTAFQELNLNPNNDVVYLCGNPGMIDEAFADLKERGFTPKQIRREKYISAKS